MSSISQHSELISALTEFYTLLSTCAAIEPSLLRLPDPATGRHPPGAVATIAAHAGGFSAKVVDLLTTLPYLDVAENESFLEIDPSTYPITYLGDELDDGYFESHREMLNDAVMHSTALKLTKSEMYGVEYIYDVETKLVTPWKPFDNPPEMDGYSHVPANSPEAAFKSLIENYRKLNYLATPQGTDFNSALFSESGGLPPEDFRPEDARKWRAMYDVWAATRKLKDIYLECGWDVEARSQTGFRRDEFLRRRERYWEDIVVPLIEREGQI